MNRVFVSNKFDVLTCHFLYFVREEGQGLGFETHTIWEQAVDRGAFKMILLTL